MILCTVAVMTSWTETERKSLRELLTASDGDLSAHERLYSAWKHAAVQMKPEIETAKQREAHDLKVLQTALEASRADELSAQNETAQARRLEKNAEALSDRIQKTQARYQAMEQKIRAEVDRMKQQGALNGPKLLIQARLARLKGDIATAKKDNSLAVKFAASVFKQHAHMDALHDRADNLESESDALIAQQQSLMLASQRAAKAASALRANADVELAAARSAQAETLRDNSTTTSLDRQVGTLVSKASTEKALAETTLHHSFFWNE